MEKVYIKIYILLYKILFTKTQLLTFKIKDILLLSTASQAGYISFPIVQDI